MMSLAVAETVRRRRYMLARHRLDHHQEHGARQAQRHMHDLEIAASLATAALAGMGIAPFEKIGSKSSGQTPLKTGR
jgi:hypothetical protein